MERLRFERKSNGDYRIFNKKGDKIGDIQRLRVGQFMQYCLTNIPYKDVKKVLKDSKHRKLTQKEFDHVIQTRLVPITVTSKEGEKKLQEVLQNNQVVDVIIRTLPDDLFQEAA